MTTKRPEEHQSTPSEEEFLHSVVQGGELLSSGKVIEAKDHLERAYELQPKNEKAQNLLGLAYFKLGLFERASEIYELLVRENPADPTLRVNLGLVYLKANALPRAIREFEIATDLAPEHRKAQNYLGLARAQAGEYGRAREHFVLAGSDVMAQRMDRALAGEVEGDPISQIPQPPSESEGESEQHEAEAPPPASPEDSENADQPYSLMSEDESAISFAPIQPSVSNGNWNAQFGLDEAPPPSSDPASEEEELRFAQDEGLSAVSLDRTPDLSAESVEPPPEFDASFEGESNTTIQFGPKIPVPPNGESPNDTPVEHEQTPRFESSPEPDGAASWRALEQPLSSETLRAPPPAVSSAASLPELAPSLKLFGENEVGPFVIKDEAVMIMVEQEVLSRAQGLASYSGALEFIPEMKRFRGRATDRSFGDGPDRVMRVRGQGVLIFERGQHQFLSLDLGEESVYFREAVVFAFQERVMFENGRVPSETPPDLDLVHLRGSGKVLLALGGPLRTLEVQMSRPVTLPLQYLVGWHGNITPRMLVLPWETNHSRAGVELQGEGFALFASPLDKSAV